MTENYITHYKSPIGIIEIGSSKEYIYQLKFIEEKQAESVEKPTILINCLVQLKEYFEGKRMAFDLPIQLEGTIFQQKVWDTIQQIAFGETKSYQQIATQIDKPKAFRAVATAIAKNPILIIIPCHRIIGSDGTIRGYAGGIDRKEALLKLEKTQRNTKKRLTISQRKIDDDKTPCKSTIPLCNSVV